MIATSGLHRTWAVCDLLRSSLAQKPACLPPDRRAAGAARHGAHAAGRAFGAVPTTARLRARLLHPPAGCCATRRHHSGCGCAPGPAARPARKAAAPANGPRRPRPRARAAQRAAAGTALAPPRSVAAPLLRGGRARTARHAVPRSCSQPLLPRVSESRRVCTSTTPSAPPSAPTMR